MMLYIVEAYLWAALLFYIVTGGADFGAGILEPFTRKQHKEKLREMMYRATGPVWEANHMWLIIAIVILFVAFPDFYASMSTYLYIPLTVLLLGIIGRGTAFAFRYHDSLTDRLQVIYSIIYISSSYITPFFLGIIAGNIYAAVKPAISGSFLDVFVYNWLNSFCLLTGLFTVSLCGFLAGVYTVGNSQNTDFRFHFIPHILICNVICLVSALLMFAAGNQTAIFHWVFGNNIGVFSVIIALCLNALLWILIVKRKTYWLRLLAGLQVLLIQIALFAGRSPYALATGDRNHRQITQIPENSTTIETLAIILLGCSVLILPTIIYLIYFFEWEKHETPSDGSDT